MMMYYATKCTSFQEESRQTNVFLLRVYIKKGYIIYNNIL